MRDAVIFTVDSERDADLLAWLKSKPNRSAVIRDALRRAMEAETDGDPARVVTEAVNAALADTLARLPSLVANAVRDALASYSLTPAREAPEWKEPPTAAANLDGLLERLNSGALD